MFHFPLTYPNTPDFVDLDITEDSVKLVAGRVSGSAGLDGRDAHALSHFVAQIRNSQPQVLVALAGLASWKANEFPPWAAYRALMSGRLLALDNKSWSLSRWSRGNLAAMYRQVHSSCKREGSQRVLWNIPDLRWP
jgi:hypothetical protein